MARKARAAPIETPVETLDEALSSESSAVPQEVSLAPTRAARSGVTLHISRRMMRWAALVVIILALFLFAARIFHWWNWGLTSAEIAQRQVAALTQKIGKVMLLPDETPVVATVTDAQSLKAAQPFYQDAQNGDVLLVYAKAERAILYRPSTGIIINVGPIYLNQQQSSQATASAPSSDTAASSTTQ